MATNFLCKIGNVYYEIIECKRNYVNVFKRKIYLNKNMDISQTEHILLSELVIAFRNQIKVGDLIMESPENEYAYILEFISRYDNPIKNIIREYKDYKAYIEKEKSENGETDNETGKQ